MNDSTVNNKYVIRSFVFVMAVMLLQTPVLNIGTISGLLSIAISIAMVIMTYRAKIKLSVSSGLLILFVVATVISAFANGSYSISLKIIIQIVFFLFMSNVVLDEKDNKDIQLVYCLICTIYAILVIYSCYNDYDFRYLHGDIELFGTQLDPNYVGIPLCSATVLSLFNYLRNKRRGMNVVFYILNCIAIVFTASRGNYLSFIISNVVVLLCFLFDKKTRIRKRIITALIIVLAGGAVFYIIYNLFSAQLARMSAISVLQDNGRFEIWKTAIRGWIEKPILGYGLDGMFRNEGYAAHNTFLEILYDYGIIGLSFFLAFLGTIAVKLRINNVAFSVLLSLIVQLFFLSALDNRCMWVILCLIVLSINGKREGENELCETSTL